MTEKKQEYQAEGPKNLKRCTCGATVFQGPFQRGEIRNGVMIVRETLYQCVGCNAVWDISKLGEIAVPTISTTV